MLAIGFSRELKSTCAYENKMAKNKDSKAHDEICSILHHQGVFSPQIERLERLSTEMQELEWKLMKRAASERPPANSPAGD